MNTTKQLSVQDANTIIDQALLNAQSGPSAAPAPIADPLLLTPTTGPGPAPGPDQQKLTEEEKKIAKAQEDLLGKEAAEQQRKEEAERKAREATLIGLAQKLVDKSQAAGDQANERIGNVPTPGSIAVPLILLLLFFFILIGFNGHTRLQWLWLVLTNNAHVGSITDTGTSTGSGPSAIPATGGFAFDIPAPKPSTNGVY